MVLASCKSSVSISVEEEVKSNDLRDAYFQLIDASYKELDKNNNIIYEFNAEKIELKNISFKFFRIAHDRELVITKPEFVFYHEDNPVLFVEAQHAVQPLNKNHIKFINSVNIISNYNRKISTNVVFYDLVNEKVYSDKQFVLQEPDGRIYEGKGFSANSDLSNFKFDFLK